MVGPEVLQTSFTHIREGYNVVATWCHGCLLSLGHYGSHKQFGGAYTQEVVTFSMKRCCIVGNTTYGSRGGVTNFFHIPVGRYEWIQQLVTWMFTLSLGHYGIHILGFWIIVPKSNKPQHEIMLYHCLDNIWDLRRCCKTFSLPIVRLEWGEKLVPWLCIEPWIIWFPRTGFGKIYSNSSYIQHKMMLFCR